MQPIRISSTAWPFLVAVLIAHPAASLAQDSPPKLAPRSPASAQSPAKPATPPAAKPPTPAAKPAAADSDQATLLGQYGEWGAYTAAPAGKKICFALGKPGSSQTNPPNRPRDPAYLFVSTRPADQVKEEVSVIIGYPLKPNSEAMAVVGSADFAMYTQNDGAWVKNAADEARLVDAMRKGADMVIKGESSRGTKTTDTFSLKGISQALDKIAQECN
jgi:hypothetical protein